MPHSSVPPCMPLVPFKLLPQCWSSEEVNLSKSMCEFFKGNCLELQKFPLSTQFPLVFTARRYGNLSLWHGSPGLGAWCRAGTPCSQDIPPEFLSSIHGCGISPFCVSTSPTSMDGCGFFNSIVVRLSFNSISDGFE